jgi:hypothetical protein
MGPADSLHFVGKSGKKRKYLPYCSKSLPRRLEMTKLSDIVSPSYFSIFLNQHNLTEFAFTNSLDGNLSGLNPPALRQGRLTKAN